MNRLWRYEDYVEKLSHENVLVRKWAFRAINSRYKRQYTDRVAELIHDGDELLASEALRYLADHRAVHHAPAILEKFRNSEGMVAGNCVGALAEMDYEPVMENMPEKLETPKGLDAILGILDYLGKKRGEKSRAALRSAVEKLGDSFTLGAAASALLNHHRPEDISLIMEKGLDLPDAGVFTGSFAKCVLTPLDASDYFAQLTDYDENRILSKPSKTIDELFSSNTQIPVDAAFKKEMVVLLERRQYRSVADLVFKTVQKNVADRYNAKREYSWLMELIGKDDLCVHLLEYLLREETVWKRIEKSRPELKGFISIIISIYFAVMERAVYLEALHPEAQIETLLFALKNSGPGILDDIVRRIEAVAPVGQLRAMLSKELTTWADISVVRLMGKIGHPEFAPDLIRVIKESDSLDYFYSDAIFAVQALDESADEAVLEAIRLGEIDSYASFDILDHLPYAEAYDLALSLWENDGEDTMGSYELFAACLENIGDPRGIPCLQGLWGESLHADCFGDSLECLCVLYDTDIPELNEIREQRESGKNRQATGMEGSEDRRAFDEDEGEDFDDWTPPQMPVKRDTPKIGRNDPCPCGSGKKYKKCCLDK